jgi:ADP-ribosylglycohydrolase
MVASIDADATLGDVAERSGTSGWVVHTVPLALVAAWDMVTVSFGTVVDQLIEIGGDTDTIASNAGQVAGARLGASRLPSDLLALLAERSLIEESARGSAQSPRETGMSKECDDQTTGGRES